MTYSQQKYDNGEYAPDSFYGRLGEIMKRVRIEPSGAMYGNIEDFGAYKILKEIIAQVEARIKEFKPYRIEPDYEIYTDSDMDKIEELTRGLEGEK